MIVTIGKDALQAALSAPARVASKAVIDYMACVLIDAGSDTVSFEATDRIESVRCTESAFIEEHGRALVPASMLAGIVKTLPDGAVTISCAASGSSASVTCGKSSFSVPALDPSDFPAFPKVSGAKSAKVDAALLARMVKIACAFAAKHEKSREYMRAVLVSSDGSRIRMTATDSYRIVRIDGEAEGSQFEALFPASFLASAASGKRQGEAVISASDNQVSVDFGNAAYVSRAVDGAMPNVDAFFSAESNASASVERAALLGAARRASAVGGSNAPVRIDVKESCISVSRDGNDEGSMSEELEAECDGMCVIHLNPAFLLDALSVADAEEVGISLENPLKPLVLTSGSMQAILMPVRRS